MSDVELTNIATTLTREVEDILSPLAAIAEARDPLAALRRFLRSAGWFMTSDIDPSAIVSAIDTVVDAVYALMDGIEPDDLGAFIEAVDSIRTLVTEITDLIDLIAAGGPAAPTDDELAAFGEDVLHSLLTRWLRNKPVIGDVATLIGLLEPVDLGEITLGGWARRTAGRGLRLRPEILVDVVSDPVEWVRNRVVPNAWASSVDAVATNLLLSTQLRPLLQRLGASWDIHPDALAGPDDIADRARLGRIVVVARVADDDGRLSFGTEYELYSATDRNTSNRPGPAVELAPFGGYQHTFELDRWTLGFTLLLQLGGVDIGDSPPAIRIDRTGVTAAPSLDARLDVEAQVDVNSVLGGNGTRLQFGALDLSTFVEITGGELDTGFGIVANESRLVLSAADLGAVIGAVASEFETEIGFDLGIKWSLRNGLTLAGSASLEIEFTEGIDIGGIITLSGLRLRLEIGEAVDLSAVTNVGIALGPVRMAFEGVGLGLALTFPEGGGNLGAANLGIAVQPPKGIGIVVDAGVVVGGGFLYLDPDRGEYAGVLELSFPALSLSLKAVGIFTTELPGDAEGYALLLLVFTEFPAIQLGYGFTLNGVGGILGIQHGVSIDALQDGMRTGALDSVLFPDDPVANAPRLLADLRAIFPISPGSLTFGPALQIGWGAGVLTVSLGLVLQFDDVIGPGAGDPSIARIVLLGQLKVELPPVDDAPEIVKLLVDIVGYYDFDESELGIDARLRDSHLAGLPLTGSLVVRARFGDDPTFILAIGGFHPRFTDLPPGIPEQDRLGVQLRYGVLTVSITAYTAITSNSFQFGAEASLKAEAASFKVEAYLGFDALFLFEPTFHFTFDFRVGAAISWKSYDLASIRVRGTVSGPGRWEIDGSATFSILFWDVEIDFHEAWGQAPVESLPAAAILPRVVSALEESDAWSASLPSGRAFVSLRHTAAEAVSAHPLGALEVRQKVVPLGVDIERVGDVRPSDHHNFQIDAVRIGTAAVPDPTRSTEHFARGEYFDLSEDDKLTSPSFERFDAGIRIGSDAFVAPAATSFDPEYETVYLEQPEVRELLRLDAHLLLAGARFGAAQRTTGRLADRLAGSERLGIAVTDSPHVVVAEGTLSADAASGVPTTYTAAQQRAGASALVVEAAELAGGAP